MEHPHRVNTRSLRLVTLLLAALAMGMKLAHALELAPKLRMAPELYVTVQSSLYVVFAAVGPVFELGALAGVALLVSRLRGRPARGLTTVSLACVLASVAIFAAFVAPAGAHVRAWSATGARPDDWAHWRAQWQYGQAAGFAMHFVSLAALLRSILNETEVSA